MTIRTKLLCAFALIALLVPLLGGVAVTRVERMNSDVVGLSEHAVPTAFLAKDVDALQREQQRAVFAFVAGGGAEDRARYEDLVPQLDGTLAELTRAAGAAGGVDAARSAALTQQVAQERERFDAAARELISARVAIEQNVETLRVKAEEMVLELTILRNRFAPTPTSEAERARIPLGLQNQVSQLLFGLEGMMSIVGFEAALALGYAITENPALKQRFEDASGAWANFLRMAKATGGPDDRTIVERVEAKFATQFEPSARGLIATAESSAAARQAFVEASAAISGGIDELVALQTAQLGAARRDAQATADSTRGMLVAITLAAFAVAAASGVWFAGSITRPLRRLRDLADRVSTGDLHATEIEVGTRDEVADLAGAFRRMTASLRLLLPTHDSEQGTGPHAAS